MHPGPREVDDVRIYLSYSNVMATVALFVALGGSSYAAVTLSKNSVRSANIKNGQVKTADLASNAVTSGKVKNGSLLSADFKAGQLPAGAPGVAGPAGAKGDAGTAGTNGANATKLFGYVSETGAVSRSSGITAATHPGADYYIVTFNQDISACTPVVSPAKTSSHGIAVGMHLYTDMGAGTSLAANQVEVDTVSPTGAADAGAFDIAVFC
jgi:hypothetical protein